MKRAIGLAVAIALIAAPGAFAQISTGNIYGKVTDESGAVLPGANVSLASDSGSQTTVSGSEGEFRFLGLSTGNFEVTVALSGFTTVTRRVVLVTNQNVDLTFTLKVATVEETLLVTAETPVVDTKKLGTSTTMTRDELQRIPQARDPWAVLRTVPGVVVDRVNIAGNESGQQASFQGKGADTVNSTWNLDGVQIDDMAAAGASPTYYDYDAFEEIAVNTGGNNLNVQTGAIGINSRDEARHEPLARFGSRPDHPRRHAVVEHRRHRARGRSPPPGQTTRPTTSSRSTTTASRSADRSSRTSCTSGVRTASRTSASSAPTRPPTRPTWPPWNAKLNWQIQPRTRRSASSTSTARRPRTAAARAWASSTARRRCGTRVAPTRTSCLATSTVS